MMFSIELSVEAADDLDGMRAYDRTMVVQAIEEQLTYEPMKATRNRKPLSRTDDIGAAWELRVGQFRVFYDVDPPSKVVIVRVILKGSKTTSAAIKGKG